MKSVIVALAIMIYPFLARAENKVGESLEVESGLDIMSGDFSSDRSAQLSVRRFQPFIRLEYGNSNRVSIQTIIATEITEMSYGQILNESTRLQMDLSSHTNLFLAQGLNLRILEYGHFHLSAVMQYEFSLWDLRGNIDSVVVTQNGNEMNITKEAREHVTARYNWQRLHFALIARYDLWKFTPFVMLGWSILDANLTFNYDGEARETLALLGYEILSDDRDHYRANSLLFMVGSEFTICKWLRANLAGAAIPGSDGWVFAGRASLIWRP